MIYDVYTKDLLHLKVKMDNQYISFTISFFYIKKKYILINIKNNYLATISQIIK